VAVTRPRSRRCPTVGLALLATVAGGACQRGPSAPPRAPPCQPAADEPERRVRTDVAAARELDREGIQSFRDGRYADAILYFRTAYRMGGPSSELWNIARAREKVDDFEGADAAIREYLQQHDLSSQDRSEADREARALRARPSVLTVGTMPPGAVLVVDGKPAAQPTPVSVEIAAGVHSISVRREGYVVATRELEARFGRAVIVSLDLARATK
jgi:PEGA domain-containing protein